MSLLLFRFVTPPCVTLYVVIGNLDVVENVTFVDVIWLIVALLLVPCIKGAIVADLEASGQEYAASKRCI